MFSLRAPKEFMFSKGFTTKRVRLQQLKPNEPHEILEMWTAPDGNQKEQVKKMREKVKTWTDIMNAWNVPYTLQIVSYKTNL